MFNNRKLIALRAFRGFKQEELANAIGISRPSLNKIETGKTRNPQLQTVQALAAFFKVPVAVFISEEEGLLLK